MKKEASTGPFTKEELHELARECSYGQFKYILKQRERSYKKTRAMLKDQNYKKHMGEYENDE